MCLGSALGAALDSSLLTFGINAMDPAAWAMNPAAPGLSLTG